MDEKPTNLFLVGSSGTGIRIVRNTQLPMSNEDALNLAAWLVALADPDPSHDGFLELVKRVENV